MLNESPQSGLRVLVAEDDPRAREVLTARLRAAGMEITTCADGQEAIDVAHGWRPDAIVSDALMPRVNGFQLCQMVRRHADLCGVAFILYTATYTEDEDRVLAMKSGADALVVKPDESGSLVDVIVWTVERLRAAPARQPDVSAPAASYFDEYARRMAAKLEHKVAELHQRNQELFTSEQEVRALNARLAVSIERLETETAERRRAQDALELAEEVAHLGSWTSDLLTNTAWCSREAAAMLGLSGSQREAFTVQLLLDRAIPSHEGALARMLAESERDGRDIDIEIETREDAYTPRRVLHVRSRLFRDGDGRALRRIGTLLDVTEQRAAQERSRQLEKRLRQAQKLESLGNLAGGIAHDFNNILTAILSHAEMQQVDLADLDATSSTLARESAEEIQAASLRARDLIAQILTFSRRQKAERVAMDPAPVVAEALRMVKASAPSYIEFTDTIAGNGARIVANAGQIHQVVTNLVTNAVQSMGDRRGELRVRLVLAEVTPAFAELHPPLVAGPALRLDVVDEGDGMDAATMARIFEPFFTTKDKADGTGLGLAVVHGIVDEHEGAIVVQSELGRGTTFSVYFPVLAERVEAAERIPAAAADAPTGRGERIMLVDDEPSVTRIGKRMLEHLGYRVEAMNDAVAAQDELRRRHTDFALVLTDRSMPRLSGEQLCEAIRELQPELPFVLMTAFGDGMTERDVQGRGFRALLPKPFTLQALAAVCAKAVSAAV
jgi:signal transduction histidine kinase/response regulator of citrate/malate metabolism